MRTEALYLDDIFDAADAIARFLHAVEKEAFLSDELYQSAVLQKLIVIGDAAALIPHDLIDNRSEKLPEHICTETLKVCKTF